MMKTRREYCLLCSFLFIQLFLSILVSLTDCSFSLKGFILVGHSYRVTQVNEWYDCLRECTSDGNCVSYNFKMVSFGDDVVCELNNCGFVNKCEAERELIDDSEYIFHQPKPLKMGKFCQMKEPATNTPIKGRMEMALSCSQRIRVYVDEKDLSKRFILCPSNSTLQYDIPSTSRLIAFEGMDDNRGQPGLIASLSNEVVTDASWKCTDVEHRDWMKLQFDDSTWPNALVYSNNVNVTWPLRTVTGIRANAKWIWSNMVEVTRHVYCRKRLQDVVQLV